MPMPGPRTVAIALVVALPLAAAIVLLVQADPAEQPAASAATRDGTVAAKAGREGGETKTPDPAPEDSEGEPVVSKVRADAEVLFVVPDGTRVQEGDLICSLDPAELDEEKASQSMAIRRLRAAYENAKELREVAELALTEYKEGIYKQELQTIKGEISIAEAERKRAEDRMEWSRTMFAKKRVSMGQNTADEVALKQKTFALERARMKEKVLVKFTYPKNIKELQGDIDKARADEEAKELAWDFQRKELAATEEQIASCRILAPVSGRLVYARWRPPGTTGKPTTVTVGRTVRWRQPLFRIVPDRPAPNDKDAK